MCLQYPANLEILEGIEGKLTHYTYIPKSFLRSFSHQGLKKKSLPWPVVLKHMNLIDKLEYKLGRISSTPIFKLNSGVESGVSKGQILTVTIYICTFNSFKIASFWSFYEVDQSVAQPYSCHALLKITELFGI